ADERAPGRRHRGSDSLVVRRRSVLGLPAGEHDDQRDDQPDDACRSDAVEDLLLALGVAPLRVVTLLGGLDLARRGRCAGLLRHGEPGYQAVMSAWDPKNSATAARSEVAGQGGRAYRNACPYAFVRTRGSRIAITPQSACDRISRPNPWRSWSTADGSEYSRNQSP